MRGMPRPWICSIAQADVQLYAPYQENDRTEQRRAQRPQRQIPKSEFVWQAQEQVYVCPQGHRLTRISQENAQASRRAHGGGEDLSLSQGALSAVPAGTAVHQQRKGTNNQAE